MPTPTAAGTLAKTPLPHLLVYVMDKKLTGTIEFASPAGERATLLVLEGYPSKARTQAASSWLSQVLIEAGLARGEQIAASMQRYRPGSGMLHGQVLLEMGIVDPARLFEGLRRQVLRKLAHVFDWPPDTTFSYYDGFDGLAGYGGDDIVTVDPLPLVWAAIKRGPSWEHAHAALSRVGNAPLRLAGHAQLERLELTDDERQFVEILRNAPRRLYELSSAGILSPSLKQLLVYCLLITRQIELVADGQTPRTVPPAPPPPATLARMQLQAKPIRAGAPDVVEERAPGLSSRDQRASSPSLTPVPKESIEAAIAEATRGLVTAPPPPLVPVPYGVASPSAPVDASSVPPASPSMRPTGAPRTISPPSQRAVAASYTPPPPPSQRALAASFLPPPMSQRPPPPSQWPGHPSPRPSSTPTPAPPKTLPPELAQMRERILKRSEEITRQDYFAMLGVSKEADAETIQKAYFLLAKVWHPDRLARELDDVRDQCAKVFSHLSEANQTLTDPERRVHYETLMKEGGATPDDQQRIATVVEAATNFQKAEICLRRNDLVQAEQLVRAATEADPQQADYIALLAWIEAQKADSQNPEAIPQAIERLDKAIKMNEKCANAYFYRGMLHKKNGNEKQAYKDFKEAADLNPRNIDAVREVRLYTMRKGQSSPPGSGSGLFGKLFKK